MFIFLFTQQTLNDCYIPDILPDDKNATINAKFSASINSKFLWLVILTAFTFQKGSTNAEWEKSFKIYHTKNYCTQFKFYIKKCKNKNNCISINL